MGRATITTTGTIGDYTVSVDYGTEIADARLVSLNAKKVSLTAEIAAQEAAVASAFAASAARLTALNTAIDTYNASDKTAEDKETLEKTALSIIEANSSADSAQNKLNQLNIALVNVDSEIARLSALNLTQSKDVWCVDYTVDATGEVSTIEVNGEQPQVLIAPGAVPYNATYGHMAAREVQSAAQVYFNAAILPGWQKFKPTYRAGALTDINRELDTGTVTLDAATSSAQDLDINQDLVLSSVPIEYMTCNSLAFENNDRVIVKFENQNWDEPKVIGFESEPRACNIVTARYHRDKLTGDPGERWTFTVSEGLRDVLVGLRDMPNPVGGGQSAYPVIVEVRPDGDLNWVKMLFYRTISHNPAAASPFWVDDGSSGYNPIIWSADGIFSGNHVNRNLFLFMDTSTDYVDWSTFHFSDVDNVALTCSFNQVGHPLTFDILADQFNAYVGQGSQFANFGSDLMEIRISTQPTVTTPDLPDQEWMRFTIKRSTRQVFGIQQIDTSDKIDIYPVSRSITELEGYAFPD